MKLGEFIKDSDGMYSSSRLFSLLITVAAVVDWMHVVFYSETGIWNPEPQTIALVLGVLGFRFAQKYGEKDTTIGTAAEKVKFEKPPKHFKIFEFLMETNYQFSSARLFALLITFTTVIDWMYSIFTRPDMTWHPETETVAMVLGVLGFKFVQKFQEEKFKEVKDTVNNVVADAKAKLDSDKAKPETEVVKEDDKKGKKSKDAAKE